MHTRLHRQSGFSMIELVVVIVVLGLITTGTAIYIVRSMQAYADTVRRDQLTSNARSGVERMVRELRNALPNSIRTGVSGTLHCLEFFPVQSATAYLEIPTSTAGTEISSVPFTAPPGGAAHVAVFPLDITDLYSASSPGPLAQYDSAASDPAAGDVRLSAAHRFSHDSTRKRLFITGAPVSFCIEGASGELRRYENYGVSLAQPLPPAGAGALLGQQLQLNDAGAVTPFTYTAGAQQRAAVVRLDLRFMQDNEWVRLLQEVQIRNVP